MSRRDLPHSNGNLSFSNHEYMIGSFSSIYMSRNRRKDWCDQSYTIQAGGRHAPLYPDSIKMIEIEKDKRIFEGDNPHYRRLTTIEDMLMNIFQ